MEGLPNWAAYGVPAIIWIVALINWMKEALDLPTKWTFPVATLLGGAVGILLYFSDLNPVVAVVTQILFGAILIGLAASGYYSYTKMNVERKQ